MKYLTAVDIGNFFGSPLGDTKGVSNVVSVILNSGIAIGGIIVLFLFLFGGLKIITSAGSGDSKSTAEGKQAVTYALIGFIIIFGTYWMIRVIELIIGVNFVTEPGGFGQQIP